MADRAKHYRAQALRMGRLATCREGSRPEAAPHSLQAELLPHLVDPPPDVFAHRDGPSPFAVRFARPLVGGVETDLGTETGDGRSEIEVVDRRVLDDGAIARRIHARGHGPDDFL